MTIRELLISIGFKTDLRGMHKAEKGISKLTRGTKKLGRTSSKTAKSMGLVAKQALALAAVFRGGKFLIDTITEFERLRAQLITIEGSTGKADAAFDQLREFAATTPFELNGVTDAYIKLKAIGLDPTMETMGHFGDVAAGFGRDITEMAWAVQSGVTGMTRPLKRFGIISKIRGKEISLTYKGVTRTVEKEAQAISGALEEIAKENFAGGMDRQMETLSGKFSNLLDVIEIFFQTVGDSGLSTELQKVVKAFEGVFKGSKDTAKSLGQALGMAVKTLSVVLVFLLENLEAIAIAAGIFIAAVAGHSAISALGLAVAAISKMSLAVAGFGNSMLLAQAKGLIFFVFVAGIVLLLIELVNFVSGRDTIFNDFFDIPPGQTVKRIKDIENAVKSLVSVALGALAVFTLVFGSGPLALVFGFMALIAGIASIWDSNSHALRIFARILTLLILSMTMGLPLLFALVAAAATTLWNNLDTVFNHLKHALNVLTQDIADMLNKLMEAFEWLEKIVGIEGGHTRFTVNKLETDGVEDKENGGFKLSDTANTLGEVGSSLFTGFLGNGAQNPAIDQQRKLNDNQIQNGGSQGNTNHINFTSPMTVHTDVDEAILKQIAKEEFESGLKKVFREANSDSKGELI